MSKQEEAFQAIVVDTVLQGGYFLIAEHQDCGIGGIWSSAYGWIRRDGTPYGRSHGPAQCLTCGAVLSSIDLWWGAVHMGVRRRSADEALDAWSRLS